MYNLKDFEKYTGTESGIPEQGVSGPHDKHAGRSDASAA